MQLWLVFSSSHIVIHVIYNGYCLLLFHRLKIPEGWWFDTSFTAPVVEPRTSSLTRTSAYIRLELNRQRCAFDCLQLLKHRQLLALGSFIHWLKTSTRIFFNDSQQNKKRFIFHIFSPRVVRSGLEGGIQNIIGVSIESSRLGTIST